MSHFHERFDIQLDIRTARERFINRAMNEIIDDLPHKGTLRRSRDYYAVVRPIVSAIGKRYRIQTSLADYVEPNNFLAVLHAIEAFHTGAPYMRALLDQVVRNILGQLELDLGIRWQDGMFLPAGAKSLDQGLSTTP